MECFTNQIHLPWTAIQSFRSSPSGNCTTERKLMPEFKDAWACLCNEYLKVPGYNFFFGRNVYNTKKPLVNKL